MRAPSHRLLFAAIALVAGCTSSAEDLQTQVAKARAKAGASQEFRSMAKLLSLSGIEWSDQKSVRYKNRAGEVRTDKWEAADLSPSISQAAGAFMTKEQISSLFVTQHQVNFLVGGTGLAPSGTTVGIVVAAATPKCPVVKALDLNASGFQCEPAGEGMYVYLQK